MIYIVCKIAKMYMSSRGSSYLLKYSRTWSANAEFSSFIIFSKQVLLYEATPNSKPPVKDARI